MAGKRVLDADRLLVYSGAGFGPVGGFGSCDVPALVQLAADGNATTVNNCQVYL